PLLDRIDLHVQVTPVSFTALHSQEQAESSDVVRQRVIRAREIQAQRFAAYEGIYCNAQMNSKLLKQICRLDHDCGTLLKNAISKLKLSARAYDRILKVSRTIADLEDSEHIQRENIAEAIQFRSLDRESWGM
ncbi:MAG TPA: magnesium chelatase, partial [Chitinophaga sp.]